MSTTSPDDNENDKHIFQLGICFLVGWMLVIILCASPQLFRNLILKYVLCWCYQPADKTNPETLEEGLETFIAVPMAEKPSMILLQQVMGIKGLEAISQVKRPPTIEIIPEENVGQSQDAFDIAPADVV
ncbi:unnamed protein product [Bursaphelenchus okinawaensis]|uniref:Uncharacterized protein n=1 Tax=Bursaphelenchus okinawaensis TaxID=465554 RepID=A0A811K9I0_9BILA|nr:unnamed protein product [Bursaphelenchus okinawaensis]CAG9097780.1 unnamed protein product [Bursaphelenchus okinawaensis]